MGAHEEGVLLAIALEIVKLILCIVITGLIVFYVYSRQNNSENQSREGKNETSNRTKIMLSIKIVLSIFLGIFLYLLIVKVREIMMKQKLQTLQKQVKPNIRYSDWFE